MYINDTNNCGMYELAGIQGYGEANRTELDLLKEAVRCIGVGNCIIFSVARYRSGVEREGVENGDKLMKAIRKYGLGTVVTGSWVPNPVHNSGNYATDVKAYIWSVNRPAVNAFKKSKMKVIARRAAQWARNQRAQMAA